MSNDAGATWKEPAPRLRGAALDGNCSSATRIMAGAAGETEFPLPRDPFFLSTTDGGESWRQQAVGEEGYAVRDPAFLVRFRGARRADHGRGKDIARAAEICLTKRARAEKAGRFAARTTRRPVIRGAPPLENPHDRLRRVRMANPGRLKSAWGAVVAICRVPDRGCELPD